MSMHMNIQEHVSLKELTTMKVGGHARYFVIATTVQDLSDAVSCAKEKDIPVVVLGGGSNMLIHGGDINALVIKNEIRGIEWESHGSNTEQVVVGAGESWDGFVAEAVTRELWGVENLSGIPGTVGASPVQNIGAYGVEIKDVLLWVEVFDITSGKMRRLSRVECELGYRDSLFKKPEGKKFVVTKVAFTLRKEGVSHTEYKDLKTYFASGFSLSLEGENERGGAHPTSILPSKEGRRKEPTLAEIRKAVLEIRSGKFPDLSICGTAGSFFKNPIVSKEKFDELKKKYPDLPGFELRMKDKGLKIKIPLAWILDHVCGLKGYEKGNVKLFEKQPIVLVQNGSASAGEIEIFAQEIIAKVKTKTGIEVEWEVAFIGGDKSHPAH